MGKPRVTVLLGAGHSQALGIPGTAELTNLVEEAFRASRHAEDFARLREALIGHDSANYNFEIIAGALEVCERMRVAKIERNNVTSLGNYHSVAATLTRLIFDAEPSMATDLYEILMTVVRSSVSIRPDDDVITEKAHSFYKALQEVYALDIVTLNYDTTVENLIPGLADGFDMDSGGFSSREFLSDDDRSRIAHIHGSVEFAIGYDAFVRRASWSGDHGDLWRVREDGVVYSSIITGSEKTEKISIPPFSIYHYWLARQMLSSPRLLIIGYGCRDLYVNGWLLSYAFHHGENVRAMVIDRFYEEDHPRWHPATLRSYLRGDTTYDPHEVVEDSGDEFPVSTIWMHGYGFPLSDDAVKNAVLFFGSEPLSERRAERDSQAAKTRERHNSGEVFRGILRDGSEALSTALSRPNDGRIVFDFSTADDKIGKNYNIHQVEIAVTDDALDFRIVITTKYARHLDSSSHVISRSEATEIARQEIGQFAADSLAVLGDLASK